MDPNELMNDGAPFNLSEIWQFPVTGGNDSGITTAAQFGEPHLMAATVRLDQGFSQAGSSKRREVEEESTMVVSTSNGNGNGNGNGSGLNDCDGKRLKTSACGGGDDNYDMKDETEHSSAKTVEQKAQQPEPPKDYIHVRARRGQATDSHSLAERARREKISERMKILQDLVPGCNKVIGKALVLDEIINYIQSLQRQVEFLSMKLEAVNTRMNPGIEIFPPKEFDHQVFEDASTSFGSQPGRQYSRGTSPEWLHMQVGGGFERPS